SSPRTLPTFPSSRSSFLDVASDQPVHRPRLLHVRLDLLDRLELVRRLLVGERALEIDLPVGVLRERVAGAAAALRVEVDQLPGRDRKSTRLNSSPRTNSY